MQNKNKCQTTIKGYLKHIKNQVFNEDGHEFISKFKEVKDLVDTCLATTRQKFVCLFCTKNTIV